MEEDNLRLEFIAGAAGVSAEDLRSIIATLRAAGLNQARIEHFSTDDLLWNTPPKSTDDLPVTGKLEIEWRHRMNALKPAVKAIHQQIVLINHLGPIDFEGPPA